MGPDDCHGSSGENRARSAIPSQYRRLPGSRAVAARAGPSMDADGTQCCVLFADVVGSTRIYEKLGDSEALRLVDLCLHEMEQAAVNNYGGRLIKTIGDCAMLVFDRPENGLLAACEMQQRIASLPPVSGIKLSIRVGFHYGTTQEKDGDVFGDTVNTAARLSDLAKSGQVVTTQETLSKLPPTIDPRARSLGRFVLKGKQEDVEVAEVIWRHEEDLTMMPVRFPTAKPVPQQLLLLHHDSEMIIGPEKPSVNLGREAENDLVILDMRASRFHARIEFRSDKFVLIDQSTNGTFVTVAGENPYSIRREETVLRGRGRLTFGHAWREDVPEFVDYAVIE